MTSLWRKGKFTSGNFYENLLVILLFAVGVHLFYAKTMQSGFVTDFTGLQVRLDGAPFRDFLSCFGFPAMHQVTNFFLYFFYKWFGTIGWPWYLIYTTLHLANGFLAYKLGLKIFYSKDNILPSKMAAMMGSLLFLFNPYNAEPVIWKVCFNYLFCSLLILLSLWQLVRWTETSNLKRLLWSHVLFVGALFTFELALVLPLLAIVLLVTVPQDVAPKATNQRLKKANISRALNLVTLPHVLLLTTYFAINKIVLGGWVGHYGADIHLKFDPSQIGSTLLKYLTKYLFFWRDWPHVYKEKLLLFLDKPEVGWTFLVVGFLIMVFVSVQFWRNRGTPTPKLRTKVSLPFILFFIALLPMSNLYVAWILHAENDRYGYLASIFLFMGIASLLMYFPKILRLVFFLVMLTLSVFYLNRNTGYWFNSSRIYYSLLEDYRWPEAKEVYVLAFPENYRGIPLFKDFSKKNLALKNALKYGAGKETNASFFQIAQYNMTTPEDGVSVQKDTIHHYTITFNQWGNWWWRDGIGTGDYETEKYRFKIDGNGSKVELKKPETGAVLIYSTGGKWYQK